MWENLTPDQSFEKSEHQLQMLELEIERLNDQVQKYFETLGMNPEELEAFLGNSDNFSKEDWEELETEREKLDQKLAQKLAQIKNISESKKKFDSLNIPPYAIFVR